ncbi:response regulator transcription factor [Psychroserpens damuponensis]|uniref:response regulator transcription factor n=1 Tax=Psychroserpens damuponensis TaxID=943936 RepID=UPI00058C6FBD|nr:response regulator transcription factor [Psychroserpens damuponensis]
MNTLNNVLIIEEEPLMTYTIIEALKEITQQESTLDFKTQCVDDYKTALAEIKDHKRLKLVFLYIDIASNMQNFKLIKDIVTNIRYHSPEVKLVTFTGHKNNYLTIDIIKTINPESILLKTETTFKGLVKAIENVINGNPFYSSTFMRLLRLRMSCDILIDKKDRLILYYLSLGIRNSELPDLIFLSKSGIENRKRNLKILFNVECKSDYFLIEQARLKGFI